MFSIRKDGLLQPLKMFWAVLVAGASRLIVHILSGVIFFGSYAPEGQNVWGYSTIYNATFLIPTTIVTYIVLLIVMKALEKE
jgi:thiamine transporter